MLSPLSGYKSKLRDFLLRVINSNSCATQAARYIPPSMLRNNAGSSAEYGGAKPMVRQKLLPNGDGKMCGVTVR
jgi:hypothetical protein